MEQKLALGKKKQKLRTIRLNNWLCKVYETWK